MTTNAVGSDVSNGHSTVEEPIYQFLDKKRREGKPYYVYMTAGANKFLRIYYARVRDYLRQLETAETEQNAAPHATSQT